LGKTARVHRIEVAKEKRELGIDRVLFSRVDKKIQKETSQKMVEKKKRAQKEKGDREDLTVSHLDRRNPPTQNDKKMHHCSCRGKGGRLKPRSD